SNSYWPNDFSPPGSPAAPYPTFGIDTEDCQNVAVEYNTITGMVNGILLGSWGIYPGVENIVRYNQIYGGNGNSFMPDQNYMIPASSDGNAGIFVRGQSNLVLTGNRIYSGRMRGYLNGFYIDNTTFAVSFSGIPVFFDANETCGTEDPVSDPTLQALVETQNQFEVCRNP
ncbi:MAG: hypothetical protein ACR2P1_14665, partial [Pseudomonadales bacterium]